MSLVPKQCCLTYSAWALGKGGRAVAHVAPAAKHLATGWTSKVDPGQQKRRFFFTPLFQICPGAPSVSYKMTTRTYPGQKLSLPNALAADM